jgi:hypothetical protein
MATFGRLGPEERHSLPTGGFDENCDNPCQSRGDVGRNNLQNLFHNQELCRSTVMAAFGRLGPEGRHSLPTVGFHESCDNPCQSRECRGNLRSGVSVGSKDRRRTSPPTGSRRTERWRFLGFPVTLLISDLWLRFRNSENRSNLQPKSRC